MFMRNVLQRISIRYKIILSIYGAIIIVSSIMGFYSYKVSTDNVVNKVSIANLGIVKQIDKNIDFLQHEIDDISTQLELHNLVQSYLKNKSNALYFDSSLSFTMSLIAARSYINITILYGLDNSILPFYRSNDGSNGIYPFSTYADSRIYKKIYDLKGKPIWFLLAGDNQVFIQNNKYPKVAMARMVRDLYDYQDIGLLIMGINEEFIRKMYSDNLQSNKGSIAVIDEEGNMISHGGPDFYTDTNSKQTFIKEAAVHQQGTIIDNVSGKSMLITYSSNNYLRWKIFYAVPMDTLTEEVNSIKVFTIVLILGCCIVLLPFLLVISSLLTAPINKLLRSMRKFQEGNFNESVEIHGHDEIGQLGKGYNDMVANIKDLINKVYVLQIKEHEAELNALQAQINPHFLYNTLDTIFWKSQQSGEKEISTMIHSLSRLFRLSLNRGEGMTVVSKEKEFIEHYLLLQKIRFKSKISYEIHLDESILNCIIPKLILQPFVENAILHGLEKKKKHGGNIIVTGIRMEDTIQFVIEDDGIGMDEASLTKLFALDYENPIHSSVSTGGYAVKNVNDRLKLIYNDKYTLNFISELDHGTRVEITVPAKEYVREEGSK